MDLAKVGSVGIGNVIFSLSFMTIDLFSPFSVFSN